MDKSKKGHSKLIIACSDPAENFKFIEETLNQMAFLIGVEIAEPRLDHITFGWDRIRCSLLRDVGANGLCSVCFILRSQNQLSKQCLIVSSTLDDKIISHCHSLVISKDLPKCFRMFHPVRHPIFYISSRMVRTSSHEAVSPEGADHSRMDMIVMASLRKR